LAKIKKSDLNSFLSITEDLALVQAEEADKKIGTSDVPMLLRNSLRHKRRNYG